MLSPVCLSSVTFVHPTQAIEIFGNVSVPFGTSAICDLSIKILRRSSQGNPSGRGSRVKPKRGSQNIAILDLYKAISRKRCKIGGKLVLISRMWAFDWYTNRWPWMTLNGVTVIAVTVRYFTEFGKMRSNT